MADRHKPGYYAEYAKRTGKKDRHRKGYYREYNKKHPERLNRGFTKGYVNGNVSDGLIGSRRGMTLDDYLVAKEIQWHDDDWYECINDD